MSRRDDLVAAATDELSRTGVSGMSLRPLARAIGTSDRMLIHYFGTREGLVGAVLTEAFDRLARTRVDPTADPARTVTDLWSALSSPEALPAVRLYLEVSARAHGNAPWREALAPLATGWLGRLESWLVAGGAAPDRAPVLAGVVSATVDGCLLRLGTEGHSADLDAVVTELARLLRPR